MKWGRCRNNASEQIAGEALLKYKVIVTFGRNLLPIPNGIDTACSIIFKIVKAEFPSCIDQGVNHKFCKHFF